MKEKLTYENFRRTGIGLVVLSSVPIVPTIIGFYVRNILSVSWENPPADTLLEYWALGGMLMLILVIGAAITIFILFLCRTIGEVIEEKLQDWYG